MLERSLDVLLVDSRGVEDPDVEVFGRNMVCAMRLFDERVRRRRRRRRRKIVSSARGLIL
jgi:hypothetical protein